MQGEVGLRIERHDGDKHGLITLAGELDLDGVGRVAAAVDDVVADQVRVVEIDASGLTFMDSAGLQALIRARSAVVEAGATFRMSGVSGAVKRVIDLAGIGDLLLTDASSAHVTLDSSPSEKTAGPIGER